MNNGILSYGTPTVSDFGSNGRARHRTKASGNNDPSLTANGQDTISIEIKFVIVSNGSLTPSWRLVRLTTNDGGTLFTAGRTRTHDLILTIGPCGLQTDNANLALQIGQAVAAANHAALPPP